MAFIHGRQTAGLYYGTQDLAAYSNDWSVTLEGDAEDVTNFASTGDSREFIRGLNTGSGSAAGMYDAAADQALFDGIADATVDAFTIVPDTQAIGSHCFTGGGLDTSFDISGSVGGVNTWSLDVQGTGFGRGILLNPATTAITGTIDNASYDGTASSANGGVAVFHFITDDITSATVKIQDSPDDAAWADLDSQALAAVDSYATVVTGTIDRYLRFSCTAFTGTTATVIAAFYRFA